MAVSEDTKAKRGKLKPQKPVGGSKGDGDSKGIDVHAVMQWIFAVWFRGCCDSPPFSFFDSRDVGFRHGGSPNMKLLYAACCYLWAVLTKAPWLSQARERCRLILADMEAVHGYGGEPTPSSHKQLYSAGWATCLYAARRDGELGNAVADLAISILGAEHAIHRVTRDTAATNPDERDGMWCPGARGWTHGNNPGSVPDGSDESSSREWSAITTGKVRGKPDPFYNGPGLLALASSGDRARIMSRADDLLSGRSPFPAMYGGPFHALRFDDANWYAYYENLPDNVENPPTRSAGCLNGERWVSEGIDQQKLDSYAGREPMMAIDG